MRARRLFRPIKHVPLLLPLAPIGMILSDTVLTVLNLVGLARGAAGQQVTTSCIDFGADFNEDLLREISRAGWPSESGESGVRSQEGQFHGAARR